MGFCLLFLPLNRRLFRSLVDDPLELLEKLIPDLLQHLDAATHRQLLYFRPHDIFPHFSVPGRVTAQAG